MRIAVTLMLGKTAKRSGISPFYSTKALQVLSSFNLEFLC